MCARPAVCHVEPPVVGASLWDAPSLSVANLAHASRPLQIHVLRFVYVSAPMGDQALRVQVTLNPSAASRDWIVNTWHIVGDGTTVPDVAVGDFITSLNTFYQSVDNNLS